MAMEIQRTERVMGPVDYLVVKFPTNRFTGLIAPELIRLQEDDIIRVIDLLFIRKDDTGNVETFEITDLGAQDREGYKVFASEVGEWLSEEDVESIGNDLPNNSAAGAVLYENLWAIKLKEALIGSGAELISQGRVPPELIEEVGRRKAAPRREEVRT